jgi:hypothetical protein
MAQATLNWTPAGGPNSVSQDVQFKTLAAGTFTQHSNVGPTVNNALITGLTDNVIHQFRIINNCSVGGPTNSGLDEDIKFTCPVVNTTPDHDSVEYSFTHLGGDVNAYDVQLLDAAGTTVIATNPHASPAGTVTGNFTGLTASTNYNIRVIPKASGTLGNYSKTNCALTAFSTAATPACAAPTNINAVLS